MDISFPNTPNFYTSAGFGSEDVFDQSFAADSYDFQPTVRLQDELGSGTSLENHPSFHHQQQQQQASTSHYPSPPLAAAVYPSHHKINSFDLLGAFARGDRWSQSTRIPSKIETDISPVKTSLGQGRFTPVSDPTLSPTHEDGDATFSSFGLSPVTETSSADREPQPPQQGQTPPEEKPLPKKRTRRSRKRNPPSAEQEMEKRERLLERNRVAASKCRQKRKTYTSTLEEQARDLQARKSNLSALANSLKDEVLYLKNQMLQHSDCGCTRVRDYLNNEASSLACFRHQGHASDPMKHRARVMHSTSPKSVVDSGSLIDDAASSFSLSDSQKDDLDALLCESSIKDTIDEGIASQLRI